MRRTVAAAAAVAALVACGPTSQLATPPAPGQPPPDYAARVRTRLAAEAEAPSHRVRYLPALCGCPPYEILLAGVWHRLALELDDPEDPTFLALREAYPEGDVEARLHVQELQGDLDEELTTCGRGAIVVTMRPTAFGPPAQPLGEAGEAGTEVELE